MLGPGIPKEYVNLYTEKYVAPIELRKLVTSNNERFATGPEKRLGKVFEYEIWRKITYTGIKKEDFKDKDILELCGGTGFLTYHLLKNIYPKSYTFNDISNDEVTEAQKLMKLSSINFPINWITGDFNELAFENKYDIIIGHSFLHHFYDVPFILEKIFKILKPGGKFISTGEPTLLSPILESRKFYIWPIALFLPQYFIELIRKKNTNISTAMTDVWIFNYKELHNVAYKIGFIKCKSRSFNFLRNIIPIIFKIDLLEPKYQESWIYNKLFKCIIIIDIVLSNILPINSYAHISLICCKPKSV